MAERPPFKAARPGEETKPVRVKAASGKGAKPAAKVTPKAAKAKPAPAQKTAPVKKAAPVRKAAPVKKASASAPKAAAQSVTLKKALVTGANGFVGSWLVKKLVERGVAVVAPVRPGSDRSRLDRVHAEVVEGDINNPLTLSGLMADVDVVFHVAGVIKADTQEEYDAVNAEASANLARLALRENPGLKRFVYVSSIAATGPSVGQLPRLESSPANPTYAYGVSKLRGEEALFAIPGLPLTVVRPPIVLGPGDNATEPLYKLANTGLVVGILGLERRFSFVDVEELVEGMITVATHPAGLGEAFHLSHEDTLSLVEAQEMLVEALGKSPVRLLVPEIVIQGLVEAAELVKKVLPVKLPMDKTFFANMTENNWIVDPHKAERLTGWRAARPLAETLRLSAEAYKEEGKI